MITKNTIRSALRAAIALTAVAALTGTAWAQTTPYIVTGDTTVGFTATKDGAPVPVGNNGIGFVISGIRNHAGSGTACTIQLGDGGVLDIGDNRIMFYGENVGGSNVEWGDITLTGAVTSSYEYGTINVDIGSKSIVSSANIANTNASASFAAIYIRSYSTFTVTGGTISSANGDAIQYEVPANITLGNDPTINGSIRVFPNQMSVLPSYNGNAFAPAPGKTYTIAPTTYTLGDVTVVGGAAFENHFALANANYKLAADGNGNLIVTLANPAFDGLGTAGSPFLIYTAAELAELATLVNAGNTDYNTAHYRVMNDIDLSTNYGRTYDGGQGWMPIGISNNGFNGVFDGNGHTISGLYVKRTGYAGLFGTLGVSGYPTSQITIKNLTVEADSVGGVAGTLAGHSGYGAISFVNCHVTVANTGSVSGGGLLGQKNYGGSISIDSCSFTGKALYGGLVGQIYTSYSSSSPVVISNSHSNAEIIGGTDVGGLVGLFQGMGIKFINCSSSGSVVGTERTGGLLGYGNNDPGDIEIENSHSTATVTGGDYVGGLVGQTYARVSFRDSYFKGDVSGTEYVGGILGSMSFANLSVIMENCYAEGNITGTGNIIGGLAGNEIGRASQYTNSHFEGNVTGVEDVGGLIGRARNPNITGCYVRGDVSGTTYVGGFVGRFYVSGTQNPSISNSYFDGNVTGTGNYVGGIFGYSQYDVHIANSYSTKTVTGKNHVGGLIGMSWNRSKIVNCYSSSDVSGVDSVGGLIGRMHSDTIVNSYASGAVSGGNCVGGLAGIIASTGSHIENSYAIGAVSGIDSVGGLVGILINAANLINSAALNPSVKGTGTNIGRVMGRITYGTPSGNIAFDGMGDGGGTPFSTDPDLDGADAFYANIVDDPAFLTARFDPANGWTAYKHGYLPGLLGKPVPMPKHITTRAFDGLGTAGSPFLIYTAAELADMATLVNAGNTDYNAAHYKLGADIDLDEYGRNPTNTVVYANGWVPIGTNYDRFSGTFDGDGKKITGLFINNFSWGGGLFGYVNGGVLKNIVVEDMAITGRERMGGIVGYINNGRVENCDVSGTLGNGSANGGERSGGVVGFADNNSTVLGCVSACQIIWDGKSTQVNGFGGVVGYNNGETRDCKFTGAITITNPGNFSSGVGGIVGAGGDVINSHSTGSINAVGMTEIGGVAGDAQNVIECSSLGDVRGNNRVGGVVGNVHGNVENCYSTGAVSGVHQVGGVAGQGTVTNSAALNLSVIGTGNDVGRVVGSGSSLSNNIAWDSMTVNGAPITAPADIDPDGVHGGNLSKLTVNTDPTIANLFADALIWKTEPGKLPGLVAVGNAAVPMPAHLQMFAPGCGTDALNACVISTAAELAELAALVNAGAGDYAERYYKLGADIDLSAYGATYNGGEGWVPIGTGYPYTFSGTFDGNGKKVTGLYINRPSSSYIGLFGWGGTSGFTIKNLNVEVASIVGGTNVGGVMGWGNYPGGSIENCKVTGGSVQGDNYVGGVAGWFWGNVISCSSFVAVNGSGNVGGVVGVILGGDMENNYNAGNITSSGSTVGGVAGNFDVGFVSRNNHNVGAITVNASGSIRHVGGVVGKNLFSGSGGSIINSSNSGDINITATGINYIGGVVGHADGSANVDSCYSTGNLTVTSDGGGVIGGVVGLFGGGSVYDSYSTGDVTVVGNISTIGGVVGNANGAYRCYSTGAVSGGSYIGGVLGIAGGVGVVSSYSTGAVSGGNYVGGLLGVSGRVENSYSTAAVSGNDYVGGLAGNGQASNSAALNPSVVGTGTNVGRVCGLSWTNPSSTNNLAWDSMTVNGAPITAPADIDPDGVHGGNLSKLTVNTDPTISGLFADALIWKTEPGKLPGLVAVGNAAVPMPAHLQMFDPGCGTDALNACVISTAAELAELAALVNAGAGDYAGRHYTLGADIDLDVPPHNTGAGWVPIGFTDRVEWDRGFRGVFDGNGKKVTGLYINRPATDTTMGLFGFVSGGGEVRGVHVSGSVTAPAATTAGGVAAYIYQSRVVNSVFVGAVIGGGDVGGVVGAADESVIDRCRADADVTGAGYNVGGVAGWSGGVASSFTNSYSSGTVSGGGNVGGVAGGLGTDPLYNGGVAIPGAMSNCYSVAEVIGTAGEYNYGGVIGGAYGSSVTNCAALGPGVSGYQNVGRVAGNNEAPIALAGNVAWDGMAAVVDGVDKGVLENTSTGIDGADISALAVWRDSSMGGRFDIADGWVLERNKLPRFASDVGGGAWPAHLAEDISGAVVALVDSPFVYTGSAFSPTVTVEYNGVVLVAGADKDYTVSYAGDRVNAGTVDARVVITGAGVFAGTDTAVYFEIEKAKPQYTAPIGLTATVGDALSSVALPNVSPDKWEWVNPTDLVGNAGDRVHQARFIPADIVNYDTAIVDVTVSVADIVIVDAEAPAITDHPQGATVTVGTAVTLSVTAGVSDGGVLTYQWYSNTTLSNTGGTAISGADGASYAPPVDAVGISYYYVVVTNTNNSVNGNTTASAASAVARIEVNTLVNAVAPSITAQPVGGSAAYGAAAVALSVTASVSDGGALTYQWYSNTTSSNTGGTAITLNGTGASYSTPNSAAVGTYYYYVIVTNTIADNGDGGVKTAATASAAVAVTVTPSPDLIVNPPVIVEHPVGGIVSAVERELRVTAVSPDTARGGYLTYRWYRNRARSIVGGEEMQFGDSPIYTAPPLNEGDIYYFYTEVINNLPVYNPSPMNEGGFYAEGVNNLPAADSVVTVSAFSNIVRLMHDAPREFSGVKFVTPRSKRDVPEGGLPDSVPLGSAAYDVTVMALDQYDREYVSDFVDINVVLRFGGMAIPAAVITDTLTGATAYSVSYDANMPDGEMMLTASARAGASVFRDTAYLRLTKRAVPPEDGNYERILSGVKFVTPKSAKDILPGQPLDTIDTSKPSYEVRVIALDQYGRAYKEEAVSVNAVMRVGAGAGEIAVPFVLMTDVVTGAAVHTISYNDNGVMSGDVAMFTAVVKRGAVTFRDTAYLRLGTGIVGSDNDSGSDVLVTGDDVISPSSPQTFEITVGPNPVPKSTNKVGIFVGADPRVRPPSGTDNITGSLTIYDAVGNIIRKINVNTNNTAWNLRDTKGRRVSPGTYLIRGVIVVDGKRKKVSVTVGVR